MAQFLPRPSFNAPSSIPKSYFLGHHHAAVSKLKTVLPRVSLVIECRDFRLPLSTHNPILEKTVIGCPKIIVYTKHDLGSESPDARHLLQKLHGRRALFWDKNRSATTASLLRRLMETAREVDSITGLCALIVGMPNVGKSTLLNALRSTGTMGRKAKVAKTGDQAGVTRKIGTSVRVVESEEKGGVGAGVYVLDSPGVFLPYVEDGETMIKISLVQGIKKGLIPDEILADYLLYKMNLWDPHIYRQYCAPTNDIQEFLLAVAKRDGKLKAGGLPDMGESAARVLSEWRKVPH
ncbi:hypothetical protein Trco_006681 [Trichoderma cornu-damae]|uniref:G domain-containing protein n=1 Tax=Trichoderma cornu-damae TaxID=654480 RepID=A0A9P8TV90_9HYPO|nr:hypothetical protein Trco_006681 [Trichoderma cornu-damae]